jgi:hypothetical protein
VRPGGGGGGAQNVKKKFTKKKILNVTKFFNINKNQLFLFFF